MVSGVCENRSCWKYSEKIIEYKDEELDCTWWLCPQCFNSLKPSERFVKENSGKAVESVSSEIVLSSVPEETPPRDSIVPEKTRQTCGLCGHSFTGSKSQHLISNFCTKSQSSSESKPKSDYTKAETKWISDFVKYQDSFDDDSEGEIGEAE